MNNTLDIRTYLGIALKWWWLLILLPGLFAAYTYLQTRDTPTFYQAKATLMVGQSIQASDPNSMDFYLSQQLARTYAEIAGRQPVLQGVVDTLQMDESWQSLKGRVQATPLPDTQLLEISVTAMSAEEAEVIANEVANQLIRLSPTELENREASENQRIARERLTSLQTKIDAGQERIDSLEASLKGSLSADQVQKVQSEINELRYLVSEWENNHTQLLIFTESNRSPNYLALIEPAQSEAFTPSNRNDIMVAAATGLLLALAIVFVWEYLDDTLKSTDDLTQTLGITALGAIGYLEGKYYSDKLIAYKELFSPVAEAYRMIRTNIKFVSVDRPPKSIMLTSSTPGEGKSMTTANLAIVMAQSGRKTLIVDADLRRPVQHEIFQIPNLHGLTDLLCEPELEPERHIRPTKIENLSIITSGVFPPNPSELLGSERMGRVVASLSEYAEVVIYDSPPILTVTDGVVLAHWVDGVILITDAGRTRFGAARQSLLNLQQAGVNILGAILNRAKERRAGYYYHHYYTTDGSKATVLQVAQAKLGRPWRSFGK